MTGKKLTDEQEEEIRRRYTAGGVTYRDLEKEYGISAPTISRIVTGASRDRDPANFRRPPGARPLLSLEHQRMLRQEAAKGRTVRELGEMFGVHASTAARALRGYRNNPTEEQMDTINRCVRCGGIAGAHFAGCLLQRLLEGILGQDYPLAPPGPTPDIQVQLEYDEIEEHVERVTEPLRKQLESMRAELDAALELLTHPDPEPAGQPPEPEPAERDDTADHLPEPKPAAQARSESMSEMARRFNAEAIAQATPAVKRVLEELTEPHPDGWISGADITRRVQRIDPDITQRQVGMVLGALGYPKRQIRLGGGSGGAPMHYGGLAWKPEPPLEEQMEKRREAEAAAGPAAEKPKERYRYDGPRPGGEISPEYREMLKPLWSIPGWSYAPRNPNGGGKPRVTNPQGTSYVIPNTPSDHRALKNTRAALRRLGAPL